MIPGLGGFHRIKFGSGVLGKTAPVAIAVVAMLFTGMVILKPNAWMVFALAIIGTVLGVGYLIASFWYGHKHHDAAVLEGAELVRYKEVELAAKDGSVIDVSPNGSKNTEPPRSLRERK